MDLPLKVSDCSVSMIEELLGGLSDWKATPDIVRITCKAITEVLKTQSMSINHLNRQLASLPPPALPEDSLKPEIESLKLALQEKVSKKDLNSALSNKITLEHLQSKLDSEEFYTEIQDLSKKLDDLKQDFTNKIMELAYMKEIQKLHLEITEKATWKEVQDELALKADLSAFNDLATKKWTKNEIDESLRFKAETKDLAGLSARIDGKAEKNFLDSQISHISNKISQIQAGIEKTSDEEKFSSISSNLSTLQKSVKNEIESLKRQMTSALNKKVDYQEIESLYESVKEKAELKHLEELQEKISKDFKGVLVEFKKDLKGLEKKNSFNAELIGRVNEDISKIRAQILEVLEDRKKDTVDHAQFLKISSDKLKAELKEIISVVEEQVSQLKESLVGSYVKKLEVNALKNDVKMINEQKLSKEDFSLLNVTVTEIKHEIQAIKDKKLKRFQSEVKVEAKVESKPELKKDVKVHSKSSKSFESQSNTVPQNLSLNSVNSTILAILSDVEALKAEQKANSAFLSSQLSSLLSMQESLTSDQRAKLCNKEVLALIENKANIDDINRALVEIHKELDSKAESSQLSILQSSLSSLSTLSILGRWHWKSGDLKANNLVPWEIQAANTNPEGLLWEKDKTSIIVLNTGIYIMNFAIFYKKKCRVQFNVNGEVLMDSGSKGSLGRNKVFSEFLMIPARARISVTVIEGNGALGLLELAKYL